MFKKIIKKLGFSSSKTQISEDVNASKEFEKKNEEKSQWNIIVENVASNGREIQMLFPKC